MRPGLAVGSAALLALLVLSSFGWGKPWLITEIDAFVSVSFPTEPRRISAEGQQQLRSETERAAYLVLSRPIPASFHTDNARDISAMFNGMVKGALKSAEGELLTTRDLTLGAATARHISYRAADTPGGPLLPRYKTLLVLNHRLYQFDCRPLQPDNTRAEADKEQFFASIKVREPTAAK